MKKLIVVGIIILLVGMSIPSTGIYVEKSTASFNGNILYVGGDGPGNYTKIQDAIDNASDGDTVFVYDGTYYENLIINKSIDLVGKNKSTTLIDAKKNGTVIRISANKVIIKCFTIQNSGRNFSAAINLIGSNCIIENNIIMNNHYGILIKQGENNSIIKNEIKDNDRDNIELFYCNNSIIANNKISKIDCYTVGINTVYCNNLRIFSNTVNKTYHGMYISATTNSTIFENSINGCRWKAIMLANSPYNVIKNNSLKQPIYSKDACDITLKESPNCIVQNNSLYTGILIDESYPNIILDNIIKDEPILYMEDKSNEKITHSCGQIILIKCDNITIQNQKIQYTVRAIYLSDSNNCNLFNNTIYNNRQGIICISTHFTNISNNIIQINKDRGIVVDSSNYNNIIYNKIGDNEDYGLIVSGSNNKIAHNSIINNKYIGVKITGPNISVINNTISNNFEGISFRFISNSVIKQNIISQNLEHGISISDSTDNILTENVISDNKLGIILDAYCSEHTIIKNDIKNNIQGLILDDAYNNEIIKNNFINNKLDAFFMAYLCKAFFNKWLRNYWDRPRFMKMIWGTKTVIIFEHATRTYLRFNIDYFPSLRPYEI
jgi:parallel beta-helix repeat protein